MPKTKSGSFPDLICPLTRGIPSTRRRASQHRVKPRWRVPNPDWTGADTRQVRCDKGRPACVNCTRHGEICIYEGPTEGVPVTIESQQRLHERLDKLERLVHDMSVSAGYSERVSRLPSTEEVINAWSPGSVSVAEPEDQGVQLHEPNICYYMHSSYWLRLEDFMDEPRDLLRWPYKDRTMYSQPYSALGVTPHLSDSLAALHLSTEREEIGRAHV